MGFYEDEIQRVEDALKKADPLSEDYARGIAAIANLRWEARAEETDGDVNCIVEKKLYSADDFIKDAPEPTPVPEPIKEEDIALANEDIKATKDLEARIAEESPFPEEPAKKWTKAEVRERLAELKKAGKDLKELFKQFNSAKLSDVKEEDYPALMAKAEEM